MGISFGTEGKNNVPLHIRFRYGGVDMDWGQPYKINDLQNSGESIDGNYRISDIDIFYSDRYGSIFQNHFGNGTIGFGSSVEVVAYLGGTMDYQNQGYNYVWKQAGTAGAYAATLHTGNIFSISYRDKLLRLRSKSRLGNLADLKWQFPVYSFGYDFEAYGSFAFFGVDMNLGTKWIGKQGFYDFQNNNSHWKGYGYAIGTSYGPSGYLHVNGYPAFNGRGTGNLPDFSSGEDPLYYPGTNSSGTLFYDEFEPLKFDGTYFGTLIGTINTDEEANSYGYPSAGAAEAAKSGTSYIINRTRLKTNSDLTNAWMYFITPIEIEGSPIIHFEQMLTGGMVTPLFTSSDIDMSALNESGSNTVYFNMKRKVWFDENKVLDSLKDLFHTTQSLFHVSTGNKFVIRTFGPKNLLQTIPSIGTADLIETSFDNLEEDYFNRFIIKYYYDSENDKFGSTYEEKAVGWGIGYDRPLVVETKFVRNSNEAAVLVQRLRSKYANTYPHISFKTNLNSVGLEIGTLLQITDPNSGLSSKTIQVVGFSKNWSEKTIDFEAIDGESLYQRRGYAFWDDGTALPGVTASGTSTASWGTNGTNNNINESIYGSMFVWW